MRLPVLSILGLALLIAGCDKPKGGADQNQVTATIHIPPGMLLSIADAAVQLPAVQGRPGAAYFTVRAGDTPVRLTSVSSNRIERIELHETKMDGNVMRMGPLTDAMVPAGGVLAFEQGGRHAMLFGIDPALKAGDKVALTFTFEGSENVETQAEVRAFGGGHGMTH